MNSSIQVFSVPAELKTLEEPSCLLSGESLHEFDAIRRMIVEDIRPATNLEWLWTLDLTELLSWEIVRYRRLRDKILQADRAKAIAAILQRLDGVGLPTQTKSVVRAYSERVAEEWCHDKDAASEINARLQKYGFDLAAVNAEVYLQARDAFARRDDARSTKSSHRFDSRNCGSSRVRQTC